ARNRESKNKYKKHQIRGNVQPTQEASGILNPNTKGLKVIPGQRNNQRRLGCGDNHRIAASVSKGMKDLHVFMDLPKFVAQTEGNHTPAMEQEWKYKKEIMDATTPFHRFQITHLLKNLNSKTELLTGLATIKFEFLNQEVSVCIKTRPRWRRQAAARREKRQAMY
nr:hypothetical protein [Tanacetum cinerariifolium]